MATAAWKPEDTTRAQKIWAEYQAKHDVSSLVGQIAGIEPGSGKVWIGESAVDVIAQRDAEGVDHPLYLVRVGFDYFVRKGERRW